jgi:hypothetical protein
MYGRQPSIRSTSPLSGAEPQSTGPTPGSSPSATGVTTAAPAPSPNSTAVLRSVQSTTSDSFSAPITSALRDAPARIAWSAVPRPYEKPEQAVFRSNAAGAVIPSRAATRVATFGQRSTDEQVATMTVSMSAAATPEPANAFSAAKVAMSATVSWSATRRSAMPTRSRIQASLVSTTLARSSFVTTRAGW